MVWRSATAAAALRGKRPDEIGQRLQRLASATNASLFHGKGILDSHAVVFTANTLCFLLSTTLSATRSVCLEVGPEGTVTPNAHMISDSNQITTPRREVSHGMSMAVSLTLGSVVSLRTRGFFKNDDHLCSHRSTRAILPKRTQRTRVSYSWKDEARRPMNRRVPSKTERF